MNSILLLVFGIAIAPVFCAAPIFDGPCPTADVDVVKNFNQTEFEGLWYIIERYEESVYMSCNRHRYFWYEDERKYSQRLKQSGRDPENPEIVMSQLVESKLFEKVYNSNDGAYTHRYSLLQTQNYHFVDTDYVNYAVLWTCLQGVRTGTHEQNLVIMARDKLFDINSLESLNATLAKPPFDRSLLKKTNQTDTIC